MHDPWRSNGDPARGHHPAPDPTRDVLDHPGIPFGGVTQSGFGLEFGAEGRNAVAVPQVING